MAIWLIEVTAVVLGAWLVPMFWRLICDSRERVAMERLRRRMPTARFV